MAAPITPKPPSYPSPRRPLPDKKVQEGGGEKSSVEERGFFSNFSFPQFLRNIVGRVRRFAKEVYHNLKERFGFAPQTLGTTDANPVAASSEPPETKWTTTLTIQGYVLQQLQAQHHELTQQQQTDLKEIITSLEKRYPAHPSKRIAEMPVLVDAHFPSEADPELNEAIKATLEENWKPVAHAPSPSSELPVESRPPPPPSMALPKEDVEALKQMAERQKKAEQRRKEAIMSKMQPTPQAQMINFELRMRQSPYSISAELLNLCKAESITPQEGQRIHDAFVDIYTHERENGTDNDGITKKMIEELPGLLGKPETDSPKGQVLQGLIREMPNFVEQHTKMPPRTQ